MSPAVARQQILVMIIEVRHRVACLVSIANNAKHVEAVFPSLCIWYYKVASETTHLPFNADALYVVRMFVLLCVSTKIS